jgi:hypothetical protein
MEIQTVPNLPTEIKWRGSTYVMERVEDDMVYWHNPVSRHREACSVENWKNWIPYDREIGQGG